MASGTWFSLAAKFRVLLKRTRGHTLTTGHSVANYFFPGTTPSDPDPPAGLVSLIDPAGRRRSNFCYLGGARRPAPMFRGDF
jgi:hypothetical protein